MFGGVLAPLFDHTSHDHSFLIRADAKNGVMIEIAGQSTVRCETLGVVTQNSFSHYAIVANPNGIPGVDVDGLAGDDNLALYADGVNPFRRRPPFD